MKKFGRHAPRQPEMTICFANPPKDGDAKPEAKALCRYARSVAGDLCLRIVTIELQGLQ